MVTAAALLLAGTLRFFGSAGVESHLTPENEPVHVADFSVFAEAAPEGSPWKTRVKLRGDASNRAADDLAIGEAFVQFRATEWLDVSAGRVIEKWGTGYGWTPTAFVSPAKDPTDPNDRRSQYSGRDMIRADLFVKDTSVALYALRDGDFAARVYRLIGSTDVSLAFHRGDAGISLSHVFGDALEVHAEASTEEVVAGAQYTHRDVNYVFEVHHGTRAQSFLRVSHDFARWKTDAELIAITNLRDGSTIARATLSHRIHPTVSVHLIATELLGDGHDFMPVDRVLTIGARVHF